MAIEKKKSLDPLQVALARDRANWHLRAYLLDKHPQHIISAYQQLRICGVPVDETMLRNLDALFRQPLGLRPPSMTRRDLDVYAEAMRVAGHDDYGVVPPLTPDAYYYLQERFRLPRPSVKMIVSRMRRRIKRVVRQEPGLSPTIPDRHKASVTAPPTVALR